MRPEEGAVVPKVEGAATASIVTNAVNHVVAKLLGRIGGADGADAELATAVEELQGGPSDRRAAAAAELSAKLVAALGDSEQAPIDLECVDQTWCAAANTAFDESSRWCEDAAAPDAHAAPRYKAALLATRRDRPTALRVRPNALVRVARVDAGELAGQLEVIPVVKFDVYTWHCGIAGGRFDVM